MAIDKLNIDLLVSLYPYLKLMPINTFLALVS